MQKPHVRLREAIWEITDQCGQNCSYCGSKSIINSTPIDEEDIKAIIDNIAEYPPEEINISGGNPLLIYADIHRYLVEKLHNTVCKIILNPFNIACADPITRVETLNLYAAVGLSVNTMDELSCATDLLTKSNCAPCLNGKTTIITNFNLANIWNFKQIEDFVIKHNLGWQIQYTMYKGDNSLAVYQNEDANNYLLDCIKKSTAKIIRADNFNDGACSAGAFSIGILANGDVIPCLSMRSWEDDSKSYGNLLEASLKDIWEYSFSAFRCREFKCCKDVTGCVEEIKHKPNLIMELGGVIKGWPKQQYEQHEYKPITMAYGINTGQVFVYGVFNPWESSSVISDLVKKDK